MGSGGPGTGLGGPRRDSVGPATPILKSWKSSEQERSIGEETPLWAEEKSSKIGERQVPLDGMGARRPHSSLQYHPLCTGPTMWGPEGVLLAFPRSWGWPWGQVTFFIHSCHLLSTYYGMGTVHSAAHEFFYPHHNPSKKKLKFRESLSATAAVGYPLLGG